MEKLIFFSGVFTFTMYDQETSFMGHNLSKEEKITAKSIAKYITKIYKFTESPYILEQFANLSKRWKHGFFKF